MDEWADAGTCPADAKVVDLHGRIDQVKQRSFGVEQYQIDGDATCCETVGKVDHDPLCATAPQVRKEKRQMYGCRHETSLITYDRHVLASCVTHADSAAVVVQVAV